MRATELSGGKATITTTIANIAIVIYHNCLFYIVEYIL